MTNRHVIVGLTWDGYDVQRQDFGVLLDITEGLDDLPQLRTHHELVPFRHGRHTEEPYADRRPIVLTGLLDGRDGTDRSDYRTYVDEVKAAFTPFRGSPGRLVATLEDGSTRWIWAWPLDMRPVPLVPGASKWSIELVATEPFWYSGDESIVMDSGYDMADGEFMDSGGDVVIVPDSDGYLASIIADGTAPVTAARVTFTGPSTGFTRFEDFENTIGWTGPTLAAGDELVVDSGLRTVTLNGVQARDQLILHANNRNGEYVRLDPGTNTIRISGQPAEVRVRYTSVYL